MEFEGPPARLVISEACRALMDHSSPALTVVAFSVCLFAVGWVLLLPLRAHIAITLILGGLGLGGIAVVFSILEVPAVSDYMQHKSLAQFAQAFRRWLLTPTGVTEFLALFALEFESDELLNNYVMKLRSPWRELAGTAGMVNLLPPAGRALVVRHKRIQMARSNNNSMRGPKSDKHRNVSAAPLTPRTPSVIEEVVYSSNHPKQTALGSPTLSTLVKSEFLRQQISKYTSQTVATMIQLVLPPSTADLLRRNGPVIMFTGASTVGLHLAFSPHARRWTRQWAYFFAEIALLCATTGSLSYLLLHKKPKVSAGTTLPKSNRLSVNTEQPRDGALSIGQRESATVRRSRWAMWVATVGICILWLWKIRHSNLSYYRQAARKLLT